MSSENEEQMAQELPEIVTFEIGTSHHLNVNTNTGELWVCQRSAHRHGIITRLIAAIEYIFFPMTSRMYQEVVIYETDHGNVKQAIRMAEQASSLYRKRVMNMGHFPQ